MTEYTVKSGQTLEYNENDFLWVNAFKNGNIQCSNINTKNNNFQGNDFQRYNHEICVNKNLASIWNSVQISHSGANRRMLDSIEHINNDFMISVNYTFSLLLLFCSIKYIIIV